MRRLLPALLLLISASSLKAQVVAFPGAQGAGAASVGGRGGVVFEVTNLNDSGTGSLRACVIASGPRTCVFRTGGTIVLSSSLHVLNPFLTIAGQTAPGGGIQVTNSSTCNASSNCDLIRVGTHDVIIRYIRARFSPESGTTFSSPLSILNENSTVFNVIFDHCSDAWGEWDNWDIFMGSFNSFFAHDLTLQWSLLAEPRFDSNHGVDIQISGANSTISNSMTNIDLHHNFLSGANHRNPIHRTQSGRIINNLVYNASYYDIKAGGNKDIVGNYIKAGPYTTSPLVEIQSWTTVAIGTTAPPSLFISGNAANSNSFNPAANQWTGTLTGLAPGEDNSDTVTTPLSTSFQRLSPLATVGAAITTDVATNLATSNGVLLPIVGASQKLSDTACDGTFVSNRDSVDANYVTQFLNNTGHSGNITAPGTLPTLAAGTPCTSTQHDGIADQWKIKYGLSTSSTTLYQTTAPNGYTYLESYLGGLSPTGGNVFYAQNVAGSGSGADCANTKSLPIVTGDWVAGNTIHLCGTFTFPVNTTGIAIVGRNGTSSSPITVIAEPGVILQSPCFNGAVDGPATGTGPASEGGAIDISATSSFIIVDGGTNGIIQNTANGTGLANSADSLGIWAGGDNIIVRNWTVRNIYNRTRGTTTGAGGSSGDIMVTGGATSIKVCNNTFNNASIGAELNFHITSLTPGITTWTNPSSCQSNTFTPGAVFGNNTLDDHNWMSHVNGSGAPVIINTQFGPVGWSNWNGDTNDFHQDGYFTVGNSAATFKPYFINNYMPGDQNQGSPSGMILYTDDGHASSGQGQSSVAVGNIFYGTGGGITCCMAIGIQAVVTGNPKGPYQWYNNTFVNFSKQIEQFAWLVASPTMDDRNNLWYAGNSSWFYANENAGWSLTTATINGNSYFGGRAPGSPSGPFGLWVANIDYPHWITNTCSGGVLCDLNSANADPLLAGESSFATGGALTPSGFIPAANSPAANLGDNLTSQCASIPNQCASMPQTVGAGGSCGTGCVARPGAGRWTAGAFQISSGAVAPGAPTGLTGTVSGSTVSLSWTAPTGTPAPTAYTEYRGTVHGGPYTAIQSGITSLSTTDTPANGTYFYVVTAFVGGIVSSIGGSGTTATVTCTTTCAFPSGTVVVIGGNSQAAFNGTFTSTGQPTGSTFTFASSSTATGTGGGAWASGAESAKSNEITVTTPATLTASFLHASLVFANQTVGTSSASQVNPFTNTSAPGGTITISGKSITGANAADFSFTDNCPSLLLSSVSCNFNVTFTPTAPGTRVATLAVTDNASGSPQTSALSGTGVAQTPLVNLNPTSLSFGDQALSTTSTVRSIILTNTGSGTLNVTSVVASGDFAVVTVPVTNCGGTLAPLATCSLNVTFTPTATGGRVGAVIVTDNAAGSPHVASLSGNGVTTKCAMSGNVTLSGLGSICQ